MKFLRLLFLPLLLGSTYAQNFELCYPFNADSYCNARFICDDEYYDGFDGFCPTYAPGSNDNFVTMLVYEFNVNQPDQYIDIVLGGDWVFGKVDITLSGPYDLSSGCSEPVPLDGPGSNFVNTTQSPSVLNQAVFDVGTYFIVIAGEGSKGTANPPYVDIQFSPEKSCIEEIDQCESCIGSFAPVPGGKYLIGAWTKEPDLYTTNGTTTKTSYDQPQIMIHFNDANGTPLASVGPFVPSGAIIDGWQRIEEEFEIPANAVDIDIELTTAGDDVLFDDVRMFPFDASMKTFVYDPVNMRLAAELDERHYATFYEYDEEGKLVRIKKETEKGVMTIQETKSNSSK
jgi:hypothetical protein